ncbi:MAG: hypothetical protein C4K49_05865 [Candidatus Thorarchaeota archaeon]|nr:MAG: hypothetical protein C4K49_05865 [Candidatus Thorarchaeota archaeon]
MRDQSLDIMVNPGVYPPSEDTYLLLDAIALAPNDTLVEVGCGPGLITLTAAMTARLVIGVDSSLEAVRNALQNARRNGLDHKCSIFQSDLLSAMSMSARFSVIVFNPPYLPDDGLKSDLDHAILGGADGTELTVRFVKQAVMHLARLGALYVVTSSLANTQQVKAAMKQCRLAVKDVAKRALFFEEIQVLRGIPEPQRKPFYDG